MEKKNRVNRGLKDGGEERLFTENEAEFILRERGETESCWC